ncbi:putative 4-coumarate-CoA ligase [Phyllosticta citribraziliensis]|uniref:4-coumarate-CoA ligase n=1 Tax=Phyllosticta citribraziliensis TaxID=989973 RepID=A0ABR1L2Q7_9PEZI
MPLKSHYHCDIPLVDLPTHVFGGPSSPLPKNKSFIDAERPERYYLSYEDFRLWSKRVALGFQRAGLKQGDRVLLYSGNSIFFPVVMMGVIMAGGVFTGANPSYVARELAYQLQDSGARFLICAEGSLPTGLEAAKSVGMDKSNIFVFDAGYDTFDEVGKSVDGIRHWSHFIASAKEGASFVWEKLTTPEELNRTVALNYSSGTTGVPKGVMITHHNFVAHTEEVLYLTSLHPDHEAMKSRSAWICFVPMYHAMGQALFAISGPTRQIPIYIMQKFDFLKFLEYIQRYRITDLGLVPPVVLLMAKHPATRKFDLSSVERVASGAAPLGREVSIAFENLFPNGKVNVKQGWGMTETTCTVSAFHPLARSDSASIGQLMPNCEAKIVDEAGNEVAQGERGEIWVHAPQVMKGYWNKPEATAETLTADGWLKTGDIAYADADGYLFIVDRKKELIKVKGNQVAPAELEALLLDHPAIADVAVIGVPAPDNELEEQPRAYVVRSPGTNASADDVAQFIAQRVARHKRLTGGVRFVEAIPKNPSGKILRKELKDLVKRKRMAKL